MAKAEAKEDQQIDYPLFPDMAEKLSELCKSYHWTPTVSFNAYNDIDFLTEFLSFLSNYDEHQGLGDIDFRVSPTTVTASIMTAILSSSSFSKARASIGTITINAAGWNDILLKRMAEDPSIFPTLKTVTLFTSAFDEREGPCAICVRTLRILKDRKRGDELHPLLSPLILDTIRGAVVTKLILYIPTGSYEIQNNHATTLYVQNPANAIYNMPRLQYIGIRSATSLFSLDYRNCPILRHVYISPFTEPMYCAALQQVPDMITLPGILQYDKADDPEFRRGCDTSSRKVIRLAVLEHTPHLVEMLDDRRNYHWMPKLHPTFAKQFNKMAGAMALAMERLFVGVEGEQVAYVDPAAFETIFRYWRLQDDDTFKVVYPFTGNI
jgi:hypothetical protein